MIPIQFILRVLIIVALMNEIRGIYLALVDGPKIIASAYRDDWGRVYDLGFEVVIVVVAGTVLSLVIKALRPSAN